MRTSPRPYARSQRSSGSTAEPPSPLFPGAPSGVLWIDDDPAFIARAGALAEQLLLHLYVASDLGEALELIARCGAELEAVFLNIDRLGEHDASRYISALRASPRAAQIPIALLSTCDDLQTRVWAAHEDVVLFLKKPVDPAEFTQAIHQLVALRRAPRPRVLIVDEDPVFKCVLREQLHAHGMEGHALAEVDKLLPQLRRYNPDAVLLDAQMPGVSGLDLCRVLRTHSRWQDLPLIMVGRDDSLGARLAAFQAGGDDFLPRQIPPAELLARIQSHIGRARLMRQRADRDPLTGLLTRRAFLESLAARLSEASRKKQKLAFCLLDLDHFKRINDTHGHLVGDRVLAGLGRLLQNRFRAEDLRGRWGGEEFVVVMANEGTQNARVVLERIRAEFAELDFEDTNGEPFRVSFSAGIAEFPAHGRDVESLFTTADSHLYAAKAAGRNRILRAQQLH